MNFFRLSKAVVQASFQCLPVACEVSEGCCMRGEMINEATVVAGETEEGADVFDGCGSGPIFKSFNFGGIHGNGVFGDDVTKEFDGKFSEGALVKASEVVVLAENVENGGKMLSVLSRILGENEDVVEEDDDEVVQVRPEDVIHSTLERSWSVGETKGHDFELVVAVASPKCCFGNIIFSNADLPVS